MVLGRRKFLKICGAGIAGLVFPLPTLAEPNVVPRVLEDDFAVNFETRVIKYVGKEPGITLEAMYNYLKGVWEADPQTELFISNGGWEDDAKYDYYK